MNNKEIEKALESEKPVEALRSLALELNKNNGIKKEDVYKILHNYSLEITKKVDIIEDVLDMISGWYAGRNLDMDN